MRILLFSLLFSLPYFAQQNNENNLTTKFDLQVKTTKGLPDAGREVVFIETTNYERLVYKTDAQGKLSITFDHGKKWLASVGEMRNCFEVKTEHGGSSSQMLTYNPEGFKRENQILPDRRSINFKKIPPQKISTTQEPSETESILTVTLEGNDKKLYSKVSVNLVCFATETIYEGITNASGAAMFKIPINQNYEIDVDGVESLKWVDLGPQAMNRKLTLLYQPRTFTETIDGKYISQKIPENIQPSSSHARVKLNIGKEGQPAINEDVYLRMLKSNKVYKAKTNDLGSVTFMLPLKSIYFVDFEFQRGAEAIDLSQIKGIAWQEQYIEYVVDPRLANIESFIPSVSSLIKYDVQNFIKKQYPEPVSTDVDFYLNWGNKFNALSKEALLEIGFKVKSKSNRKSPEPLNLCFVIDKSGSMYGEDRLEQVKRSLINFIRQLDPTDVISIVVFDNGASLAVPSEPIGDKKKITDIIYSIQSGGGTNILDGMVMGFEQVKKTYSSKKVNRVILLTDGYDSNPPQTVIDKAKTYIKGGIELSAVGVGADFHVELLSQLASAGGGLLHLAGTSSNIEEIFQRELETILYPMAKKATLTVTYNDRIVYRQLYGYENEKVIGGKMSVEIPHLFPGLDQLALVKFDLINPTKESENQEVVITLEYIDAVTGKPVVIKKNTHPEWTTATGELDMTLDQQHKTVLAIANVNQLLKVMANANETGNKAKAEEAAQQAMKQLTDAFPRAMPEDIIAMVDRLQQYVDAFELMKLHSSHGN